MRPEAGILHRARRLLRPSSRFTVRDGEKNARRIDWRAWIILAWIAWFGTQYAAMMVREKAPGLWVSRAK